MPLAMGDLGLEPLATQAAAVGAGHVGLGPGLIDEDELGRVKAALILNPLSSSPRDRRPILLAGEQAFF